MFILVQGKLRVALENGLVLENHGPAGMVGELGVITGERRAATVIAMTDCLVMAFGREELAGLFRRDTELQATVLTNIIRDLAGRMRREDEVLEELRRNRSLEVL
jgi:CRP-like cAMP-binding protein